MTPEVPPENLISGNTRQESIELDVSNLVSLGILDYDDLLNFEILVTYNPPGTSEFQGNVLLEINDLNLQIQTTGGTFVRKAKEFYTIFSGSTKKHHIRGLFFHGMIGSHHMKLRDVNQNFTLKIIYLV